jgi:hypothetical protein
MSACVATKKQKTERKALQVEVKHPNQSIQWTVLWEFDQADWIKTQMLIDELNTINALSNFESVLGLIQSAE